MRRKVPTALADHVEKNNLQGKLKYSLFVGASSGAETENRWARLDMIERRSPHQVGKEIAKGINEGRIKFFDKHLSMFPVDLVYVRSSWSNPLDHDLCSSPYIGLLYERSAEQQAGRSYRRGFCHYGGRRHHPRCFRRSVCRVDPDGE